MVLASHRLSAPDRRVDFHFPDPKAKSPRVLLGERRVENDAWGIFHAPFLISFSYDFFFELTLFFGWYAQSHLAARRVQHLVDAFLVRGFKEQYSFHF